MNSKISVKMCGKSYVFPMDIITYVEEHHFFEKKRQELLSVMSKAFYVEYPKLEIQDEQYAYNKFKYYADICVKRLVKRNILNVTVEDFIGKAPKKFVQKDCIEAATNDGIKMFYEGLMGVLSEFVNAQIEHMESFTNQAQQAEWDRDSQITGTGFGIITNDIISYNVWAAMEKSTIKKQAKVASAEFVRKIDSISNSAEAHAYRRVAQYVNNVWMPNLENAVNVFIITLFNQYIDILTSYGCFDAGSLNYVDIGKAESILSNIDATENKLGIIDAAFTCSPICFNVYVTALSLDEDIADIIESAKSFGIDGELRAFYEEKCNKFTKNIEYSEKSIIKKISPYITILSFIYGTSEKETINNLLRSRRIKKREQIKKVYRDLIYENAGVKIKQIISGITNCAIENIGKMSEDELRKCIREYLIRKTCKRDDVSLYEDALSDSTEEILLFIKEYVKGVEDAYSKYMAKKQEYESAESDIGTRLEKYKSELESVGLFAFSKKKQLKEEIYSLEQKFNDMKTRLDDAERHYIDMTVL